MSRKGKNSAMVSMTKSAFIKEHKTLIPILKSGSKSARLKEAREQQAELNKYLNG